MAKLILFALLAYVVWAYVLKPRLASNAPARPLDEREARAILGVGADADADAIRAAHRRLVAAVHPDRGGSEELARRINRARDVLLRNR